MQRSHRYSTATHNNGYYPFFFIAFLAYGLRLHWDIAKDLF